MKVHVVVVELIVIAALVAGAARVYRGCSGSNAALSSEQRGQLQALLVSDRAIRRAALFEERHQGNAIDAYVLAMKRARDDGADSASDERVAKLVVRGASSSHVEGWHGERASRAWPDMVGATRAVHRAAARQRKRGNAQQALVYLLSCHRLWQDLARTGPLVYAHMGAQLDRITLARVRDILADRELDGATRRVAGTAYRRLTDARIRASHILRNELDAIGRVVLAADASGRLGGQAELVAGMVEASRERGGGLNGLARITRQLHQLVRREPKADGIAAHNWGRSFGRQCARVLKRSLFCDVASAAVSANEIRNAEFRVLAARLATAR